jgi:hypothetical protein
MRLRRRWRFVVAMGVAWMAGACAILGPSDGFRTIQGEEALLVARLREIRAEGILRHSLRAMGSLRIDSLRGSVRTTQVVLAQRPGWLRIESLSPLGQTATLLVSDGEWFSFFDGRTIESGETGPDVLRDRLQLDFTPEEAIDALLLSTLRLEGAVQRVRARGAEREVWFERERVGLDAAGRLASHTVLGPEGEVRWRAEFSDWRDGSGGSYPFRIVLSFPRMRLRADLELSRVEVDPLLPPDLFLLPGEDAW